MLHRSKPPNQGLWNGIGGRIEPGETPEACAIREIEEETGYRVDRLTFGGLLTWEGFEIPPGGLYLFTAPAPPGEPVSNSEGELAWKDRAWTLSSREVVSNIRVFGPHLLAGEPARRYHFVYQAGEIVTYAFLPLEENYDERIDAV